MLELIGQGIIVGLVLVLLFSWHIPLYLFLCFIMASNFFITGEFQWLITLWPIVVAVCLPQSIKNAYKEQQQKKKEQLQKQKEQRQKQKKETKSITSSPPTAVKKIQIAQKPLIYKPTQEEIQKERNKMTAKVRARILARDNYTCQICGLSRANEPHLALHVDHIIPVSKGGKTVDSNLQCLCWQCNLKKSDKF